MCEPDQTLFPPPQIKMEKKRSGHARLMLSIHNNLSAGAQNVTGTYVANNYACLQVLVNNMLKWQSSCVIANNT